MARPPLQVEMRFDHLHCHQEGDGIGSSEAYLWTIYFKIDGDSVALGDDLFLHGNCTLIPTPGSHGNLGDSDIDPGDDVPIPAAIGEFHTTLRPIPVPAWVRETFGVEDVGGVVGVACVLMEENWVSDAGAEAGHQALNNFVRQAIDDLIPTLGVGNTEVTDEQIAALTSGAADAVSDAVSSAQGVWDNIGSWLNGDELLGTKTFTFTHDALIDDAFHDMQHRFQKFVRFPNFPNPVLVVDFELLGNMQGVQTCPVAATLSVLQAQGFISKKNAGHFVDVANGFRRKVFAGNPALGAWWQLAERNIAAIAGLLYRNPKMVKKVTPAFFLELAAALAGKDKLSEKFIENTGELLRLFAKHGGRRLRIDSKTALRVLPQLSGKRFDKAIDILHKQRPGASYDRPVQQASK